MKTLIITIYLSLVFFGIFGAVIREKHVVELRNTTQLVRDCIKVHTVSYTSQYYGEVLFTYGINSNHKHPNSVAYLTNVDGELLYTFKIHPGGFQITSAVAEVNKITLLLAIYDINNDCEPYEILLESIFYELPTGEFSNELKELF